jgi:hypothetical protein
MGSDDGEQPGLLFSDFYHCYVFGLLFLMDPTVEDLSFSRWWLWGMPSSGMLRRVALVRTDVSEELSVSHHQGDKIGELGTLAVTSNFVFLRSMRRLLVTANVVPSSPILVALMIEALSSSETSVLTRATRRNIPEGGILRTQQCLSPVTWGLKEIQFQNIWFFFFVLFLIPKIKVILKTSNPQLSSPYFSIHLNL